MSHPQGYNLGCAWLDQIAANRRTVGMAAPNSITLAFLETFKPQDALPTAVRSFSFRQLIAAETGRFWPVAAYNCYWNRLCKSGKSS